MIFFSKSFLGPKYIHMYVTFGIQAISFGENHKSCQVAIIDLSRCEFSVVPEQHGGETWSEDRGTARDDVISFCEISLDE